MTDGAKASNNGNAAEGWAKCIISSTLRGISTYSHKEWVRKGQPNGCLVTNFPYTNIYGSGRARTEFVLIFPLGRRIRIEVKWQETHGSVDEKFPFLLENAVRAYPEAETILIVDGGGARTEAVDWLKNEARTRGRQANRSISVLSLNEFKHWANSEAPKWSSEHSGPTTP